MLIYNFQKEFLGIDDSDLRKMGFQNLSELRAEAADFADLFVKTPGFIHNFKHVHWIDFVECAESDDSANVIIHANNKNFRCTIEIKTAFLVDAPAQKAYLIYLNNLRELSKTESDQVANDVYEKPTPQAATIQTTSLQTQKSSHKFDTPVEEEIAVTKAVHDPYEQEETKEPIDVLDTPAPYVEEEAPIELDVQDSQNDQEQVESFSDDDFKLDIDVEDTDEIAAVEPAPIAVATTTISEDDDSDFDNSYVYDPHVASDELGLPLDLIEEFIGDFIAQAHEFKDQLYTAHDQGDEDKVKVLSHKLKGVAANLRIEDAFEVLSIINTSTNHDEIRLNLNRLYKIIAKLSNEDTDTVATPSSEAVAQTPTAIVQEIPEEDDDDDFSISFKDDDFDDNNNDSVDDIMEVPENDNVDDATESIDNFDDEELYLDKEISIDDDSEQLDIDELSLAEDDEVLEIDEPLELDQLEDTASSEYDKNAVAKEIGIDLDSFNELFDDFIDEGKLLIKDIDTSIEEKNIELWRRNALKLKGMADNMRIDSFKKDLDTLIQADNADAAKEAVDKIQISLEKISNL
jgi:hypothetical protein